MPPLYCDHCTLLIIDGSDDFGRKTCPKTRRPHEPVAVPGGRARQVAQAFVMAFDAIDDPDA